MRDWNIERYKYQSPIYSRENSEYNMEFNNPNYQYGYTHFPSYTDIPLPPYEQMMRAEQRKVPAHMICDCGGHAPVGGLEVICVKCGKDWSKFVGSRENNIDHSIDHSNDNKKLSKETFADLSNADNVYIVLLFVFFIFLSCLYTHICALRTEIDILKQMRPTASMMG
jgi:hypothetical protein